jgi:hypothetical protein
MDMKYSGSVFLKTFHLFLLLSYVLSFLFWINFIFYFNFFFNYDSVEFWYYTVLLYYFLLVKMEHILFSESPRVC